jgi:CheY-like chemotaxis protein
VTNVLVAEDNPVNRELLRELLEGRGYNVIEAPDGQEALRMIEETHPDILLLDMACPYFMALLSCSRSGKIPA